MSHTGTDVSTVHEAVGSTVVHDEDRSATRVTGNATYRIGAILLVAGILLLVHLGTAPLWGSEGRWATIARGIYRNGNWFEPMIGSTVYWDKPLLSYWLVLPFAWLGGGVGEAAARLPSVVAALLMLVLTIDLARRWADNACAVIAGGVLATTYSFLFWGRNAQVEMLNATAILFCIWYFVRHKDDSDYRWLYFLGMFAAIGANLKGLPAYAVPGFSILFVSLIRRDWKWFPPLRHVAAAGVLSIGCYLLPSILARLATGEWSALELVWRENVVRALKPFDHTDPIWCYFVRIFDLAAPWSLFLPAALFLNLRHFRDRVVGRSEVLYFAAIFLFFTLSGSRRPYYLLPILPFSAMVTARFLQEFVQGVLARPYRISVYIVVTFVGIVFVAPMFALWICPGKIPPGLAWGEVFVVALVLAGAGIILFVSCLRMSLSGMFCAMTVFWLCFVIAVVPIQARLSGYRAVVAELATKGEAFAFYRGDNAKVVFYLDRPYVIQDNLKQAHSWALENDGILISDTELDASAWKRVIHTRTWDAYSALPVDR